MELRESTDVPKRWLDYGERLMSMLGRSSPQLLLLLDEFPVMLEEIALRDASEARQFLRWFRSARIAPETRVRFVIGGSINLVTSLDEMGLVDTINDLHLERLRPFDRPTAEAFVRSVFAGRDIALPHEVLETILVLVGEPIPYFLQVLLGAILDRQKATGQPIDPESVRQAFEDDLLGGGAGAVFQHYRSRLDRYYPGSQGTAAKAILGTLSRSDQPVGRDTVYAVFLKATASDPSGATGDSFARLMAKLENDFYVVARDSSYGFFSRVLQLWWRTHYGYQGE